MRKAGQKLTLTRGPPWSTGRALSWASCAVARAATMASPSPPPPPVRVAPVAGRAGRARRPGRRGGSLGGDPQKVAHTSGGSSNLDGALHDELARRMSTRIRWSCVPMLCVHSTCHNPAMIRPVVAARPDPPQSWPGGLCSTCRPELRPPLAKHRPSNRDLIGPCAPRPIAGLSARSAGACHPLSTRPKEMAVTTMAHPGATRVTVGVDTHGDVHVAHAGDQLGCRLDTVSVPTTPSGYRGLLAWARGLGELDAWGVA